MSRKIPLQLRLQVAERAGFRCEYCLSSEADSVVGFEVDHITSLKHEGPTTLENLAYSCIICNRNKGSDLGTRFYPSKELIPLFNPRQDKWREHFECIDGLILEKTDVGKATIKVLVEGRERARVMRVEMHDGVMMATLRRAPVVAESPRRLAPLVTRVAALVEQYVKVSTDANLEQVQAALRLADPGHLVDHLADKMKLDLRDKQSLLEVYSTHERLLRMIEILEVELEKNNIDRTISTRTKRQMEKQQREYYLNEKIKAIHKELGRAHPAAACSKDQLDRFSGVAAQVEAGLSPCVG